MNLYSLSRMMSTGPWAIGSTPVLILPDIRRTVVAKLRVFLQTGEVLLGPGGGGGELQELQELLKLLHFSLKCQVNVLHHLDNI